MPPVLVTSFLPKWWPKPKQTPVLMTLTHGGMVSLVECPGWIPLWRIDWFGFNGTFSTIGRYRCLKNYSLVKTTGMVEPPEVVINPGTSQAWCRLTLSMWPTPLLLLQTYHWMTSCKHLDSEMDRLSYVLRYTYKIMFLHHFPLSSNCSVTLFECCLFSHLSSPTVLAENKNLHTTHINKP